MLTEILKSYRGGSKDTRRWMSSFARVVEGAEAKMREEWRVKRRGEKEEEERMADHGSNSPDTLNTDLSLFKLYRKTYKVNNRLAYGMVCKVLRRGSIQVGNGMDK